MELNWSAEEPGLEWAAPQCKPHTLARQALPLYSGTGWQLLPESASEHKNLLCGIQDHGSLYEEPKELATTSYVKIMVRIWHGTVKFRMDFQKKGTNFLLLEKSKFLTSWQKAYYWATGRKKQLKFKEVDLRTEPFCFGEQQQKSWIFQYKFHLQA